MKYSQYLGCSIDKHWAIPEKIQVGLRTYFLRKKKEFFTKASSREILQNCIRTLGNSKAHENLAQFFLHHSGKFHFFLNCPLEFPHALSSILLEIPWIPCPRPPTHHARIISGMAHCRSHCLAASLQKLTWPLVGNWGICYIDLISSLCS